MSERTAELAHEVLIRSWPTLRRWLDEDREGIRLYRRLCDAARLWDAAGRDPGDLYRGTRLDSALEWAKANEAFLNETERDFLNASVEESPLARTPRALPSWRPRRAYERSPPASERRSMSLSAERLAEKGICGGPGRPISPPTESPR